jgi:hypothetical protein
MRSTASSVRVYWANFFSSMERGLIITIWLSDSSLFYEIPAIEVSVF